MQQTSSNLPKRLLLDEMGGVFRMAIEGPPCAVRVFSDQSLVSHSGAASFQSEAYRISVYVTHVCVCVSVRC